VAAAVHAAKERAARDAGLTAAQSRLDAARQRLARATSARRAKEGEIEDLNLRVRRTSDRLASGKLQGEREVQAAQTEIARLQQHIGEAEAAWIEISAEEEEARQAMPEEEAALQVEERDALVRQAAAQREAATAEARLTEIDHLRREAVKVIPAEIRERYRALYPRTGGRPFATVDAGECSHCRRSVPAAAVQALRARTGVPQCPSCGRLLLMP
jgi:predicted  nucleic acid-binding Zn-ribbon protein